MTFDAIIENLARAYFRGDVHHKRHLRGGWLLARVVV